jgi:hypothetical protein
MWIDHRKLATRTKISGSRKMQSAKGIVNANHAPKPEGVSDEFWKRYQAHIQEVREQNSKKTIERILARSKARPETPNKSRDPKTSKAKPELIPGLYCAPGLDNIGKQTANYWYGSNPTVLYGPAITGSNPPLHKYSVLTRALDGSVSLNVAAFSSCLEDAQYTAESNVSGIQYTSVAGSIAQLFVAPAAYSSVQATARLLSAGFILPVCKINAQQVPPSANINTSAFMTGTCTVTVSAAEVLGRPGHGVPGVGGASGSSSFLDVAVHGTDQNGIVGMSALDNPISAVDYPNVTGFDQFTDTTVSYVPPYAISHFIVEVELSIICGYVTQDEAQLGAYSWADLRIDNPNDNSLLVFPPSVDNPGGNSQVLVGEILLCGTAA